MATDKELVIKGIKLLAYTLGLMFLAPIVLYQAFKNTDHSFYIPVLILGLILAIMAIALGFYSIKVLMDGFFTKKK
ncbi:DUF6095 family protein [Eudoraea sp.]|uniref:DUF6095 family protein n=1 Tax=Eudoraea sp. TaxID=1979955 RepID=UPI003C7813CE